MNFNLLKIFNHFNTLFCFLIFIFLVTFVPFTFGQEESKKKVDIKLAEIKKAVQTAQFTTKDLIKRLESGEVDIERSKKDFEAIISGIEELANSTNRESILLKDIDKVIQRHQELLKIAKNNREKLDDKEYWSQKITQVQNLIAQMNEQRQNIVTQGKLLVQNIEVFKQKREKIIFELEILHGQRSLDEMKKLSQELAFIVSDLESFGKEMEFGVKAAY